MATRYIGDAICDHGAQFFTVRGETFREIIEQAGKEDFVREWCRGFPEFKGSEVANSDDGHIRYRGTNGMASVSKMLAQGLDVRLRERVSEISNQENAWWVKTENDSELQADALILTPPVPQSIVLIHSGNFRLPEDSLAVLEKIRYESCFAVMAVLEEDSKIPKPGALRLSGAAVEWIADNRQKGISSRPCVTIHAKADFTEAHWDEKYENVAQIMLDECSKWLGSRVLEYQVHRWRYSKPVELCQEPYLFVSSLNPLLFTGDAFAGPKVEGAVVSGIKAANRLVEFWGAELIIKDIDLRK